MPDLTMQPAARWLPIAPLLFAGAATAQYVEARNAGMGGVGAASSDYLAAGWANPALLTRCRPADTFGLLLPTIGAAAYDRDGLVDDIKDFADAYDRLALAGGGTAAERNQLADQLEALDGRQVTANAGLGAMLALPSRSLGVALHAKTYADLQAFVDIDAADVAALRNPGLLPSLQSQARVVGAAITEVGVSLATELGADDEAVSIGVTPKYQRVDTCNYGVVANDFEAGDFDDRRYRNDDAAFNVDVGVAWTPGAGFTLGVTGRNLIGRSYATVDTLARSYVYRVDPTAVAGVAWTTGGLTLAVDLDLLTTDRFASGNGLGDDDVRLARLGGEFDVAGWLQLRAGYQTDLEDTFEDAFTAGLGFVPLGPLRFDLAGAYVDRNSFGAFAQLGLTF
ncbi:MAG: conjugal transfer protein TraF [Planctomycetota bacterium]